MKKVKDAPKARGRGPESPNPSKRSVQDQVESALAWLKGRSTKVTLEGMARYSIPLDHAYGVAMKDIKALAPPHHHGCGVEGAISFADRAQGHVRGLLDKMAFVTGFAFYEGEALFEELIASTRVVHGETP